MAADTKAGEVSVLLIIKNREIVRVEQAPGTEGKVTPYTAEEKLRFSQSPYGCRPIETIYDHDTQGPNTCYIIIDGYKIEVPCG